MTLEDTLAQLEALGTDGMPAQNRKHGAGENPFDGPRAGSGVVEARKRRRPRGLHSPFAPILIDALVSRRD